MAQPTNTYDSYDIVGLREDLSNIIYNVDPYETPFLTMCSKVKAKSRLHEWQTDTLRASAANAHIEGDDTVAEARTATVRLGNYTQIFKNAVTVPDTDAALDKAGRATEMAYQLMKVAKEQKLDIEAALFANTAKSAGSGSTPRYLAGLPTWLYTNTEFETGSSGADPTGDGSNTRTDDGTPVAFSQTRFNSVMQSIWREGGKTGATFKCFLSDFQLDVAAGFVGNNNQRNTVNRGQVVDMIDLYVTSWGKVEFIASRENRARDVFILRPDMWAVAELRGMRTTELAKTGDNEKRQVVCELTLVSKNEKASGAVYDNTVA